MNAVVTPKRRSLRKILAHRPQADVAMAFFAALIAGATPTLALVLVGVVAVAVTPIWVLVVAALTANRLVTWMPLPPLTLSDFALIACLVRLLMAHRGGVWRGLPAASAWLLAFFLWTWMITLSLGASITPLSRLTLYGAVSILLVQHTDELFWNRLFKSVCLLVAFELTVSTVELPDRMFGLSINDPGLLGNVALFGWIFAVENPERFKRPRTLAWLFGLGIIAVRTRGIWVAFFVVVVVRRFRRARPRHALAFIALALAGGLVLYGPVTNALGLTEASSSLRLESIADGLRVVARHPVSGTGWARSLAPDSTDDPSQTRPEPDERPATPPFNLFVNSAASTGLVGATLLSLHLLHVLSESARRNRALFLYMVAFLTVSVFEMTFYAGGLITILYFVTYPAVFALRRADASAPALERMNPGPRRQP